LDDEFWAAFFVVLFYIPLLFLWAFTLIDLFGRHDINGWAKAAWAVAILFFPIIGVIIYFIARPKESAFQTQTVRYPAYDRGADYSSAPTVSQQMSAPPTAQRDLETINHLHSDGVLSDEEYRRLIEKMTA
jgi:hypothetical protein